MNAKKLFLDKTRQKIMRMLSEKEMSAGEIASEFDASWPNISQHLNVMKENGFVKSRREGQFVFYSLNKEAFLSMIGKIMYVTGISATEVEEFFSKHDEKSIDELKKKLCSGE